MTKLLAFFFMLFAIQTYAQNTELFFEEADAFFNKNVSDGKIDYPGIAENPGPLNELMEMASAIKLTSAEANKYQAFWINAYNLSVIKGVIDNYPLDSPLSVAGFFDKITYTVSGKAVTLNDIENKMLRKEFNDPRIHFVLVCGAVGCPPIINKAYTPESLESQLTTQTKLALNGVHFIQINTKKKRVVGSEILKWYKEDFTLNGSTEIDFINKYRTEAIPDNYKLSYSTYDWTLNTL